MTSITSTIGTASTYRGPAITIEGIRRALAELEGVPLPDKTPIRLTEQEVNQLASMLGLQARPPMQPPQGSSILGIPIVVVPADHPVIRVFTLKQRIERSHFLLRGFDDGR